MKKLIVVAVVLSLFSSEIIAQKQKRKSPKTEKEKISYSIGVSIGRNMKIQEIELDQALFTQGIKDGLGTSKTLMSEKDIDSTMRALDQEMMAKMQEKQKIAGEKNAKEGEAFLEENRNKEGVITLPSGLQYKIIKAGDGPKPTKEQSVKCHYRGTLIDGTEFDSSYKRGEPAEFPLNGVIKGWTEALQLMPVGSKWQLFIPSNLAYGASGAGQTIGPNATLIFDVELLSIK
ncbi:MAG: FKBP-type peptidyl-prolyl cis-trans isomerase [Bacteroidetes bacterium]|nr:FKBP-type peptidyl-prolyl cis-trans isomerase [Bacteroidota bacterium]